VEKGLDGDSCLVRSLKQTNNQTKHLYIIEKIRNLADMTNFDFVIHWIPSHHLLLVSAKSL
jgi:hypothetical protein